MALHMAFKHCVCIKPEAADLLEFIRIHLKKIKIGKILCSHFNIEDERRKSNVFSILCFITTREVKNTTETHKKRFEQCMEKVLSLIKRIKSGLRSFMLEISHWTMLHGHTDQLKLAVIKSRH